jgi:hypothetical protein
MNVHYLPRACPTLRMIDHCLCFTSSLNSSHHTDPNCYPGSGSRLVCSLLQTWMLLGAEAVEEVGLGVVEVMAHLIAEVLDIRILRHTTHTRTTGRAHTITTGDTEVVVGAHPIRTPPCHHVNPTRLLRDTAATVGLQGVHPVVMLQASMVPLVEVQVEAEYHLEEPPPKPTPIIRHTTQGAMDLAVQMLTGEEEVADMEDTADMEARVILTRLGGRIVRQPGEDGDGNSLVQK